MEHRAEYNAHRPATMPAFRPGDRVKRNAPPYREGTVEKLAPIGPSVLVAWKVRKRPNCLGGLRRKWMHPEEIVHVPDDASEWHPNSIIDAADATLLLASCQAVVDAWERGSDVGSSGSRDFSPEMRDAIKATRFAIARATGQVDSP